MDASDKSLEICNLECIDYNSFTLLESTDHLKIVNSKLALIINISELLNQIPMISKHKLLK